MELEFKPDLREAAARMQRLWCLEEPQDRVPAIVRLPEPPGRMADGSFFGRLGDYLAHQEQVFRNQAQVRDESIPIVHPQYGHALISALCGSPIRAQAETVWSVPIVGDLGRVDELCLNWDNSYGVRYREEYQRLLEWARGRCAVSTYEIEGVADTMCALRGAERLWYDLADDPHGVQRFAERVTDLLIEFDQWSAQNVAAEQDLAGGIAVCWSLWMPKGGMTFAEDATVMLSPELYRRHIKEHDCRLTSAFTKALLEVHAEGNHQIGEFGEVDGVTLMVIENPLRMRPQHRDAVRQLLGKKAFYISVATDEIEDVLQFTGTRGILLGLSAETPEQAREVLDGLERITARRASHGT